METGALEAGPTVTTDDAAEDCLPARDRAGQLAWFAGAWRFEREVTEGAAVHQVRGTAEFTETTDRIAGSTYSLDFLESGELRMDGSDAAMPVQRRLTHHATPGGIEVRFAQGGHYLTLDLAGGECVAEHPCRADTYLITVTIDGPDAWTERWQVSGPTKNYSALTRYWRG